MLRVYDLSTAWEILWVLRVYELLTAWEVLWMLRVRLLSTAMKVVVLAGSGERTIDDVRFAIQTCDWGMHQSHIICRKSSIANCPPRLSRIYPEVSLIATPA